MNRTTIRRLVAASALALPLAIGTMGATHLTAHADSCADNNGGFSCMDSGGSTYQFSPSDSSWYNTDGSSWGTYTDTSGYDSSSYYSSPYSSDGGSSVDYSAPVDTSSAGADVASAE